MLKWLLIGLLVYAFYRYTRRLPAYTNVISPEHLMNIAVGLDKALAVAVAYIGKDALDSFLAGGGFTTSGRVGISYTIAKGAKGGYEHHIAMNGQGKGPLFKDGAAFIAAGIGRMLGYVGARGVLAESKTATFYFIIPFSDEEHAKLVKRGIEPLDMETARKFFDLALEDREHLLKNLGKLDVKLPQS